MAVPTEMVPSCRARSGLFYQCQFILLCLNRTKSIRGGGGSIHRPPALVPRLGYETAGLYRNYRPCFMSRARAIAQSCVFVFSLQLPNGSLKWSQGMIFTPINWHGMPLMVCFLTLFINSYYAYCRFCKETSQGIVYVLKIFDGNVTAMFL